MSRGPYDLLYELLARLIFRVGLPGEDELHGPAVSVHDAAQAVGVAKYEGGALVGREAARKADCERLRVQRRPHRGGHAGPVVPELEPFACEFD